MFTFCRFLEWKPTSILFLIIEGPSWSWSHSSWIYNHLCNQCLSSLMTWVRIPLMVRQTIQHYVIKMVNDLRQDSVSSTNKTDNKRHNPYSPLIIDFMEFILISCLVPVNEDSTLLHNALIHLYVLVVL